MIVPRYFEDLSVLHENTLPVRAYYVPASGECVSPADPPLREASGRLTMLSGREWLFRYYKSIHDLKEEFFREGFTPEEGWRREQVPFCWQMRGYDENQYTNILSPLTRPLFRSKTPAAFIFIILSGTGIRKRPAAI